MGFESMGESRDQKLARIAKRSKEIVDELNVLKKDRYAKEDQMNAEKDEIVKQALKMELMDLDAKIDKIASENSRLTQEVNEP